MAKDEGDGQISRDLMLKKEGIAARQSRKTRVYIYFCRIVFCIDTQYKVTVYTGKKRGAGTDADVFITLYGDLGETGAIMLDDKKNNFESGK